MKEVNMNPFSNQECMKTKLATFKMGTLETTKMCGD